MSPVNEPVAAGLNSMETVQALPAASVVPQVLAEMRNDVAFVPPRAIEVMSRVAVPELVRVRTCAAVAVPTLVVAKVRLVAESFTAGVSPVPERVTFCGEPAALSVRATSAVRAPAAAGLNSTEKVQVLPAARVVPQVLAEMRKDVVLVPPRAMDVMSRVPVPELVRVMVWAAVVEPTAVAAKVSAVAESLTAGVAATPVPLRATVCGEPVALSAMESDAARAPAAAGLNSTETVQLAAAARLVPQVVADFRNELALVPVTVSEESVTAEVPVFLMVTSWAAVVEPTVVEAKVRLVGETVTVGVAAAPVPEREILCGEFAALS